MLNAEQKRSYNYLDDEEKVKENIIGDGEFLEDAKSFLVKREGYTDEDLATKENIYDAYMEHFRYQNVNEVTAIRDLEYAQNANQEDKEQFARLIDLFETQKSEGFFNAAGDYIQGIASAPSTYAGIITGGAGKLAALSGVNLAKIGIKKLLGEGVKKSAIRAGLTEGAIGTGQGLAQEMTKTETGYQDEISGTNIALTGGISGITGGVIGGGAGILQTKQALKAAEKLDVAQTAQKTLSTKANAKAKATLQKNKNKNTQKYISKSLNALDPEKVDLGIGIAREIADAKELGTLTGKLPTELYENISAAALDLASKGKLKIKKGDRITTVLQRAIADGDLKVPEITKILKEYNLTADKFSLLYKAELSEAGKTMQVQSNIVQTMQASLKELENVGVSTVGSREAKEIAENANKGTFFKDLDRLRLGAMTSQPATTMRNNINAGLRVAVDMAVRTTDNILNLRNPFDSVFDVAKYMFNPSEANVTRQLLEGNLPDTARKLFRDAADLASTTGGESKLAQLGTKLNYFNTMSDNFFKQAMLTASLRRRVKDANIKGLGNDLDEIIATGKFNQIPDDIMNKSIKDSLEFVYQSSFEGADKGFIAKKTRGFLKAHRDMPFVISSFMPFPRFIANQMKFLYDHAPVIGYIGLENIGKKAGYKKATLEGFKDSQLVKEKAAKQIAGASMFATALAWRNQQGDGVTWSEFKDDKGDIIDGKALYGPFAPFMLAADIYYRWSKSNVGGETDIGEIAPSRENYIRETLQALAGSQFRTGYGFYALDQIMDAVSGEGDIAGSKGEKILGEFVGNVVNTFTIPLSPFKDIYSQFDKESRFVPETRMSGEVNFLDIVMKRGFRALPDVGPEYDMPLADPTKTGRIIAINPLEKQMFGFTRRPKKNTLQAEMGTLNLQYYNIYRRDSNDLIDLYTRHNLSAGGTETNLNERLETVIKSDEYKRRPTLQEKRDYLLSKAKDVTALAKDKAKVEIEEDSKGTGKLSAVKQQIWGKIPESDRKTLDTIYKRLMREDTLSFADEGSDEIKDIRSNLNRLILRPNGEVMPLYQWALQVYGRRLSD
tara:strand:- start:1016 stop:4216 length:3201 start_codon:yes stop_codon:yes gene_type:complete